MRTVPRVCAFFDIFVRRGELCVLVTHHLDWSPPNSLFSIDCSKVPKTGPVPLPPLSLLAFYQFHYGHELL